MSGIGLGCVTVSVPTYIGELSPPAIRGSLIGLYEINNQLSSLFGFWVSYFTIIGIPDRESRQWQIPLGMQMIPAALLCMAAYFLPESPRWLIEHDRVDRARRILSFIRRLDPNHEYICYEVDRLQEALIRQRLMKEKEDRWQILRELTWPGNRNRIIIGCIIMWSSNMTGTMGINQYAPSIFQSIGIKGTTKHLFLTGFYSLSRVITTILSLVFFIDMTGRRKLLLTASVGIVLSLTYIGAFNTATVGQSDKGAGGWVSLAAIYTFSVSTDTATCSLDCGLHCTDILLHWLERSPLGLLRRNLSEQNQRHWCLSDNLEPVAWPVYHLPYHSLHACCYRQW